MQDFANKNYASKKISSTARGFIMTLVLVLGGVSIVVVDHVGQQLQHQRVLDVVSR